MSRQTDYEEEYYDDEEVATPKKKRSFSVFLAMVFALAAAGVYVFINLDPLMTMVKDVANQFTNVEFLLQAGFILAVVLGVICALIALFGANKGAAVFTWIFFTAGAAALFVYTQLYAGGIVETITAFTEDMAGKFMTIIPLAAAVLAFLFSFIGMFVTRTEKVVEDEYDDEEFVEEEEVAPVAPKTKRQPQPIKNPPIIQPIIIQTCLQQMEIEDDEE